MWLQCLDFHLFQQYLHYSLAQRWWRGDPRSSKALRGPSMKAIVGQQFYNDLTPREVLLQQQSELIRRLQVQQGTSSGQPEECVSSQKPHTGSASSVGPHCKGPFTCNHRRHMAVLPHLQQQEQRTWGETDPMFIQREQTKQLAMVGTLHKISR